MPRRTSGTPLFIRAMLGLGDGVYQRPFIRAQAELRPVYVTTPFPELYADLPDVHPVRPIKTSLRTQLRHVLRLDAAGFPWATPPKVHGKAFFSYALRRPGTILDELEKYVGLGGRPFRFDLPDMGPSPVSSEKPVAVIRPVTTRREWINTARAPLPEYVAQAALVLRHAGFHVVAVADIDPPAEWLVGEIPPADEYFVRGELPPRQLLALIRQAAVVVGGSGFIVPCAIAAGTPLVVIGGGQGGHNAPERLTDPRMDLSRTRFVMPDRFCPCTKREHPCDKRIAAFPQRFRQALLAVTAGARAEAAA